MNKPSLQRHVIALGRSLCYSERMDEREKDIAEDYAGYDLTPEQIRTMKFDQWSHAVEGMHISDEDMLRMTKHFYATGKDKQVKELLAKAERENRPFSEVLQEHRRLAEQA